MGSFGNLPLGACLSLATVAMANVAAADEDTDAFVEANLLSVLYHELGHALIDIMALPVFGQEEDAADVASILLIDAFYEDESATDIAYDAAFGFMGEAENTDVVWSDVHGPDLQRYYNLVCLFAGADMEAREDVAIELGLPDERLENCEDEFALANESWGPVLDQLTAKAPGASFVYKGAQDSFIERLLADEAKALNQELKLPLPVTLRAENCDEPNAFYDLDKREIVICEEFEGWLRELAQN